MTIQKDHSKWLRKKSKTGFRGYPIGSIAFYGPDDRTASKVAVGVVEAEGEETAHLRRWFADSGDIRRSEAVLGEVIEFLRAHSVRSVAMPDRIIGCPHEEGVDYPDGEACPQCPFWADRDRWTGKHV
jgi:hypothetical protein